MEVSGNNYAPAVTAATSTAVAAASAGSSSPLRTGSPPWTQIVRGIESEVSGDASAVAVGELKIPLAAENQAESSDDGNAGGNGKKPAWNKKLSSNGAAESGGAVVMGAASWPALSASTKASPKLSPSESLKSLPDSGSVTALPPAPQLQSSAQSPLTSPKLITSNVNYNPTQNHGRPARQKSMKRDGGSSGQGNGGFSHQPSPREASSHSQHGYVKPGSGVDYESSSRDNTQNHAGRDADARNSGGDHPQQRNSFRKGNGGPQRGDGLHQNYGGKRGDQERGNHDWNHQRSFNGREGPVQPRGSPRSYVRTPPVSAPFILPAGPAALQPFMSPMGMPDMPLLYYSSPVPLVATLPAPLFFPPLDPQLKAKIANQIEYYFSNENLVKDTYLRRNMDENGWVPVVLIAGFQKVMKLTDNIQLILDAIRSSTVVEVQGDKIRKRGDWMRWIMPSSMKFTTGSGLQSPTSPNVATLSAHIQSVTLDEKAIDINGEVLLRSSSGDLSSPSQASKDGASSSGF